MEALKQYIKAIKENAQTQIPEKDGSKEAENAFYYCDGFIDACRFIEKFIKATEDGEQ